MLQLEAYLATDCQFSFAGEMTYVNLQLNPERYTGYTGPSPRRIWDAIYTENCPKCMLFFLQVSLDNTIWMNINTVDLFGFFMTPFIYTLHAIHD